jgi:hypothetical protein
MTKKLPACIDRFMNRAPLSSFLSGAKRGDLVFVNIFNRKDCFPPRCARGFDSPVRKDCFILTLYDFIRIPFAACHSTTIAVGS